MKKKTIKDIKIELGSVESLNDKIFNRLKNDPRKGVRTAVKRREEHLLKLKDKKENFLKRFKYEKSLWKQGYQYVAGIDEVGRGPLAGPVVTCAIILPRNFPLIDVNDSKQLSPKKRKVLYPKILKYALAVNIGIASNHLIDKINIYQSTKKAMLAAVNGLDIKPDHLIIDAMSIDTDIKQTKLYQGDAKSVSIGAASIVAKVYRDHLMDQYSIKYPEYDFKHNAGYGTKKHLIALKKLGATPIHRLTFNPVNKYNKK